MRWTMHTHTQRTLSLTWAHACGRAGRSLSLSLSLSLCVFRPAFSSPFGDNLVCLGEVSRRLLNSIIPPTHPIQNVRPPLERHTLEDCEHRKNKVVKVGDAKVWSLPEFPADLAGLLITLVVASAQRGIVRVDHLSYEAEGGKRLLRRKGPDHRSSWVKIKRGAPILLVKKRDPHLPFYPKPYRVKQSTKKP
jgi:hypothetical protein